MPALVLNTQQPKVISAGNVIVAAKSNLDDEEEKDGFEWRRTDWTDDFASNTGTAYLFDGMMEGYIRNLYTEKLWKYRPYYESADGQRYCGEWVGENLLQMLRINSSQSRVEPFLPNTFPYNRLRVVAMLSFEWAVSTAMSLGCWRNLMSRHTWYSCSLRW